MLDFLQAVVLVFTTMTAIPGNTCEQSLFSDDHLEIAVIECLHKRAQKTSITFVYSDGSETKTFHGRMI